MRWLSRSMTVGGRTAPIPVPTPMPTPARQWNDMYKGGNSPLADGELPLQSLWNQKGTKKGEARRGEDVSPTEGGDSTTPGERRLIPESVSSFFGPARPNNPPLLLGKMFPCEIQPPRFHRPLPPPDFSR